MKRCPRCDQTYNDESLNFCLQDGAPLVLTDSVATVVIPKTVPSHNPIGEKGKKTSRVFLWVTLGILVLLLGGGVVLGLLFYFLGGRNEVVGINRSVNVSSTPRSAASPKPSPSPSAATGPVGEPSPAVAVSKPASNNAESDEITPIAWNTSGATFKTDSGQTYKFQCPENGTSSAIWGSDIYTADSSICTAAVHAGLITLDRGGIVTVEFRPGRQTYGSTTRNGITSNTFGEYPHSFVVR